MKNTNASLIDQQQAATVTDKYIIESDTDALISKWKRLNAVRIAAVTVAYGVGMGALLLAV